MSNGLFFLALQQGEAHEVAMDEVRFVAFTEQSLHSVGTRNLNGCTAVMIVSQYGAILAHIPPRPAAARHSDPQAGDQHCVEKMNEMAATYRTNQRFFPADKPSWVVSALWQDEIALPSQRQIIEAKLREMGLNPASANYKAVMPPQSDNNTKGTVFIDARAGGIPRVYVEDILVERTPTSTRGGATISAKPETGGDAGPQTAQSRSQQPQQDVMQRVHDGLLKAESHEEFVKMANDLKTRFKGQSADVQRQFVEVVKRVRDERQKQQHK